VYDSVAGLGVMVLTPFSTIFQLYRGGQFIGGEDRNTPRKLL